MDHNLNGENAPTLPNHQLYNTTSMNLDRTPAALVIWGCFLEILMVLLFQIKAKRKAVTSISIFVTLTVVSNTALLLIGPIKEINDIHLKVNSGEFVQQPTCVYIFLIYFLYINVVYGLWTGIAWVLQTLGEFVSSFNDNFAAFQQKHRNCSLKQAAVTKFSLKSDGCLLPTKSLNRLCVLFGLQSAIIALALRYYLFVLPEDRDRCLNQNWVYQNNRHVSLYFFITFGLPVVACLFLAVYISNKTTLFKKTGSTYPFSLADQDHTTILVLLAVSVPVFLSMMIPASIYITYLSTEFDNISTLTDPSLKQLEYRLVFYKYVLTNLVLYWLALHILMVQMFTKEKYGQEFRELFPCLYDDDEKHQDGGQMGQVVVTPLPDGKILDCSKFKDVANDIFK